MLTRGLSIISGTKTLSRILISAFLLFLSLNTFAQLEVKKGSFKEVPGFVNVNSDPNYQNDDNDLPFAVIKVRTENINEKERKRLNFSGNMGTFIMLEYKEGEVWVYVTAKYADYLKISHPDFSSIEYTLPYDLKAKHGYEMVLVNKTGMVPEVDVYNYLVVTADQPNAAVYIDDVFEGEQFAQKSFIAGEKHSWRIECELYHTESGEAVIPDKEGENVTIEKKLRPAFGYLNVTSSPESGAIVYIDGKKVGVTPFKTDKLASGEHKVRVMKEMYSANEKTFTVTDGNTTQAPMTMNANFVNVTVTTDSESDIYVDNEHKGKGSWSGRLSDGNHTLEARKASYRNSVENIKLTLGKDERIVIPNPTPIYGTIDVSTNPIGANIVIDGKNFGTTPRVLTNVLVGTHELRLEKTGCTTVTKTITLDEKNKLSINEKLNTVSGNTTASTSITSSSNSSATVFYKEKNKTKSTSQNAMPCPVDPNVRIGELDNGMTYYIRHNEKPAGRADFYIAQLVGSILEEDNQRGFSHFLERMAFKGTTNFPGTTMTEYLGRRGLKFGENINAGTGIDQTVYMITNIPTKYSGLVDSCLLILHDWSSFIALEEAKIDNERGVILDEFRTREDASDRIMKEILPIMYPDSPYANHLPYGGNTEVIRNFRCQELRDYYHKWYRPDLQGIIIVGDIDVDAIEARIKKMFADIKAPAYSAPRPWYLVKDNTEPIVAIASDPEATRYDINIFYKTEATADSLRNDINYWIGQYALNIISSMEINRLQEITQKANPPFIYGYSYYSNYYIAPTEDAWCSLAMAKDAAGIDEAITALVTENKRMAEFGFTEAEYERAKANFLKQIESQYEDRNNTENSRYVNEILNHFISNEPMMGVETEYTLYQQVIPNIPLEVINLFALQLIHDDNVVITVKAPKKSGETLPTAEEIMSIYEKAKAMDVGPYEK